MSHPIRCRQALALVTVCVIGAVACHTLAADWPGWRGPTGVGLTDEKDLPLRWDGKSGENVLWKTPLKDLTGHSSPIVWGDRIFLTTAGKQTRQQEEAKKFPHIIYAAFN